MSDNTNNTIFKASSKILDGNTEIKWNSPICAFVVERRTLDDDGGGDDGQWQAIGHVPADRDSFSMRGESSESNCKFEYRVVAKMSNEISLASQPTGIPSLAEKSQVQINNGRQLRTSARSSIIAPTPPGQPQRPLDYEWISPRSFKLSWNPPRNDGGSPITSYIIERADDETGDTWTQLEEVHASRSATTSLILTSYHNEQFGIVAVNACGRSEPLRTETLRPLRLFAPEVEVDTSNENYIELKWTFPADRLISQMVKFKHFDIGRRVGNEENFVKICNDVKGNSYRDADVTDGQRYQYEVTVAGPCGSLNCTRTDAVIFQATKMKQAKRRRERLRRRRLKRKQKKMAIQEDPMQSINQADEPGPSGVKQEFQEQQEASDMKLEAVDSEVTPDTKVIKMEIDLE